MGSSLVTGSQCKFEFLAPSMNLAYGVHNSWLFLDFSNVKKQEKYFEKQFILHYKFIHSFYFDSLVSGNIRSMSATTSIRNTFVRGSRNRKDSNR